MVLRRATDHRRAADVDILDNLVPLCTLGDGLGEGVEIDDHQIDPGDIMFFHRGDMAGIVAPGEQTAVHFRMKRLHPAVHHFGEVGDV